jgi:hypothetical protein
MPPALFALVIFGIGSHFFLGQCGPRSPIYVSQAVEMTGVHHHAQIFVEIEPYELWAGLEL